jgi:anaerobic ribonucleoside-triphosphate reductase activating protein
MIKYKDCYIVFEEIPDMLSLAINLTNCQNNCVGCHSPELRGDGGRILTKEVIDELINDNFGINCVLFMGEGKDRDYLLDLAKYVKTTHNLKTAIYSGREKVEKEYYEVFDYIKVGPYIEKYGPLNSKNTNQRLYLIDGENIEDITYKFWIKGSH